MDKRLPDTPWHLGYAKKDEDDPRRHKARCIHYKVEICNCTRSYYYQEKCGGSSHCAVYSESDSAYEQLLESKKSADEIAADNREKYRQSLIKRKRDFVKKSTSHMYKGTEHLNKCLLCDDILKKLMYSLKKCQFCGLYYVNIQDFTLEKVIEEIKAEEVMIMNIPQPKRKVEQVRYYKKNRICKHINKSNRCTVEICKYYSKRCKEQGCPYFEER